MQGLGPFGCPRRLSGGWGSFLAAFQSHRSTPMSFRIRGLSPEPFRSLYGLSDEELASHGARRVTANADHGFPDRIEMRDAKAGETLLLVNHEHHAVATPYRSSYAIYVLEGSEAAYDRVDEIPEVLARRL